MYLTDSSNHNPIRAQFRAARVVCLRGAVAAALAVSISPAFKQNTNTLTISSTALSSTPTPAATPATNPFTGKDSFFAKSSAQVATPVLPQVVIPESCELKLDQADDDNEAVPAKRSSPLTVRASDSQKEILRRKAKTAGVSLNRYMLAAALGADDKPTHDPEWTKALLASNRELTRQGNNLNQIAHKRNSNLIDEAQTNSMLGILARAYLQTHKAVRAALSQGKEPQP